ncbi:serine--tRNA ligase [Futiania mangrovi]|uniref:Serine--tRNA ligase n=1 Tax=Futiania mangrovi TaxID=2959716 RepID=A0A9J6PHB6_9PROT|nr:serine--tRNA ligase [Futiania mangrovii]MCP1335975.1 serine--tRNA ligase [Futiania mangrovii]
MLDIRWIRENADAFDAAMTARGAEARAADLVSMDDRRRSLIARAQEMQTRRNAASKEIGQAKGQGDEARAQALMAEVTALKTDMQAAEDEAKAATDALDQVLATLPNIPASDVPEGADESENVELRRWGTPRTFDFAPKQHFEIGEALGHMDFERASKLSGARFSVLTGPLARLERALAQFMLDRHTDENGYMEVNPPFMVRDETMFGTGQLPKFGEDLFRTTDGRWLIPTAEVPLTNLVREEILDEAALPMRLTAWTPCFRAEAGAAGKDTRGLIRQHQFAKVELVSITTADASEAEHERMTACAEGILQALGLPYRVIVLCTGDMGFSAAKTYDIEVWLPGQDTYREISSCSNCRDFQARRMNARVRAADSKKTEFVHTLNGSGLAVGRTLVAVLENYQNADGSVTVPEALRPYMGGMQRIEP